LIDPPEAGIAECAIVVLDEYQGRGLGKHLMRSLILYARNHGVSTLRATVHATNQPILRFIQSYGLTFTRKVLEPGVLELQIHLPQDLAE
jgi:acetyltransferase